MEATPPGSLGALEAAALAMRKYSVMDTGAVVETDGKRERVMCHLFDEDGIAICGSAHRAFQFGGFIAEILNAMQLNPVFREQVREAMNKGRTTIDDDGKLSDAVIQSMARKLRTS